MLRPRCNHQKLKIISLACGFSRLSRGSFTVYIRRMTLQNSTLSAKYTFKRFSEPDLAKEAPELGPVSTLPERTFV